MPNSLTESAQRFRQRLMRLDNQPLSKAALVVIIFLDLFVLGAIFNGLANHTRQLEAPDERIPPLCRDIVVDAEWNPANRLDRLAQLVTRHRVYGEPPGTRAAAATRHALCAPLVGAYQAVRDDRALAQELEQMARLDRQMRDLRAAQAQVKDAYDTKLLEQLASRPQADENLTAIRKESADRSAALENLVEQRRARAARIEQDPRV